MMDEKNQAYKWLAEGPFEFICSRVRLLRNYPRLTRTSLLGIYNRYMDLFDQVLLNFRALNLYGHIINCLLRACNGFLGECLTVKN